MARFMTKKEMVYSDIKKKILTGELKPGDRLHIRSIAQEYGISEMPVREAIQALEHERLSKIIPHVGAIVSPMSQKELHEIMDLRLYLESLAASMATSHFTQKHFEELEAVLNEQKQSIDTGKTDDFGALNLKFHSIIYQRCPNSLLTQMIHDLRDKSIRYTSIRDNELYTIQEIASSSYEEHLEIYQAIRKGNAAEVQFLMQQHKLRVNKAVISAWTDVLIASATMPGL